MLRDGTLASLGVTALLGTQLVAMSSSSPPPAAAIKPTAAKLTTTTAPPPPPPVSSSSSSSSSSGIDNTQAAGINPIYLSNFRAEYLGIQRSDNTASRRDLGFTGRLAGKWYAIYGDTLWTSSPDVTDPDLDQKGFHGMARDTISECTADPLVVHDLRIDENKRQQPFVPYNESWGENKQTGFGGTSLVEVDADNVIGAVYYVVNLEPNGTDFGDNPDALLLAGKLVGAGVARVEMVDGVPTVTRRYGETGYWWPRSTTPIYGDKATYLDEASNTIYLWGGPPANVSNEIEPYVFQARVQARHAFDLSRYEYWWGRQMGWRSDVLTRFDAETAVMWQSGQGQVVWSPHFQCYIFVGIEPLSNDVMLKTAPHPEGPWAANVKVFEAAVIDKDGGLVYAGLAHPYLDPTGKTLTVGWTNSNRIEMLKVTFD